MEPSEFENYIADIFSIGYRPRLWEAHMTKALMLLSKKMELKVTSNVKIYKLKGDCW